ncbi:hypothetical protein EON82_05310 [bacterium]|nr:MAG: hypothetical protein EON82_05310 [bacterium]
MSGSLRLALILLAVVFAGWFAIKITTALVGWVLSLLIPIAAIAIIGGIAYVAISKKALGGSRRTLP